MLALIKGEAGVNKDKKKTLTKIIDKINELFGTSFTKMDKVLSQMVNDFQTDARMMNFVQNNDKNVQSYL